MKRRSPRQVISILSVCRLFWWRNFAFNLDYPLDFKDLPFLSTGFLSVGSDPFEIAIVGSHGRYSEA
jgi:hypothetical protein